MEGKLSRRDFLKRMVVSGLTLIAGSSIVSGSGNSDIPKTDISLSADYLAHVARANKCINIDDGRCTYRENGNCSGCYMLEYFVTDNYP